MMQEKINSFRGAFVDLAADYVKRVAVRAAQQEPEAKGAAQQFRYELANDIQIANTLAETIEKMQKDSAGELPLARSKGGEPEPVVKLGPGASFRLENTPIHGQYPAPDGVKVDAVERLQNLCSFCKEMERYRSGDSMDAGRQYGLIKGRAWGIDVVMLEFAISILSELKEIKEVRISAEPNTPGAWELMRGVLAGKWQMPEGCAFNITVDAAGNALDVDPEPKPGTERALTISMPGGTETVKLTSIAEAYGMADCIKKMAACVWPEAANEPAPGGA